MTICWMHWITGEAMDINIVADNQIVTVTSEIQFWLNGFHEIGFFIYR